MRQRWLTASELVRLIHAQPSLTRTEACDRLQLTSGAATELLERLRGARLVAEDRAEPDGRGRPTTILGPHPDGPLIVVVDLRSAGWRILLADLVAQTTEAATGSYDRHGPAEILPELASHVAQVVRRHRGRVRAVVAAVAGTVAGTRLLQFATRGWVEADLGVLTGKLPPESHIRLLAGNDATLGGIAEARTGAARGAGTALHILVAVGVGGALLVDGQPVAGARGAGGEYGHLPFGDPRLRCPCGAHGCWDLMVDGRALARSLGHSRPDDPIAYGQRLLADIRAGDHTESTYQSAADLVTSSLGAGLAGLVNLHDPDVVTLAGLAPDLRATSPDAFTRAFGEGLMDFHRRNPPPVLDGVYGQDGTVRGAISLGIDEISTPMALERWSRLVAALQH